jgi:hypothetical protein
MRKLLSGVVLAVSAVSCKQADIDITNPNVALAGAVASDPTALQLLATGLMVDQRGTRQAMITNTGTFGREMYTLTPNEGRNTTNYLVGIIAGGQQKLDPGGFANGSWTGEYGALRDIYNFKNTINASVALTAQQKSAALGFAETLEALMLFEIVQTRHRRRNHGDQGNPFDLAPFVTRDSMYKYVLNTLDDANTKLAAGGTAFPFNLAPGFGAAVGGAAFNTTAGYAQFNRALKAKAAAHYATAGGGAAAWQSSLTALAASFLNASATTRTAFDVGVYDTYAPSPDSPNGLTQATNSTLYAHMSFQSDAQNKANGSPDDRYTAKIRTGLPARTGPITGDGPTSATTTPVQHLADDVFGIPIIRNEELTFCVPRAACYGDKAGAMPISTRFA